MKRQLLLLAFACCSLLAHTQNDLHGTIDPHEVRLTQAKPYNLHTQQLLREQPAWKNFVQSHGTWYAHFNETSGMPHRAYGQPLSLAGNSAQEKAMNFAQSALQAFQINTNDLVSAGKSFEGKNTYVNFRQHYEGLEVMGSRYTAKFHDGQLIMFGCDVYPNITLNTVPSYTSEQSLQLATSGITNTLVSATASSALKVLPVPGTNGYSFHLVYDVLVKTISTENIPANYQTLVDAHTGVVLYRQNRVKHSGPIKPKNCGHSHPKASATRMLEVSATVTGTVQELTPNDPLVTQDLENIYVTVANVDYTADQDGNVVLPVNPGSTATVRLMGPWSRIYTADVTPSLTYSLVDGPNAISMDGAANVKELSAYRSVQRIHDWHKQWMIGFDGMDFQLPTNIDVTGGTCNAFYDGASINFYDIGGGCNATSLIADVCYHEYGHGINDNYYQSQGSFFMNGAIGEGYADFWAISATNNPILGAGFNTDNLDPIRRYDEDPKVYPTDLVGEVHADGEIIMGAWWDSHLLMGADWNVTMPLFVETYAGLQAEAFDGNEGEAFTDVLIDLLQADDDDGDLTNGTPHGNAIVEGFYIHGITLISNAQIDFVAIPFLNANVNLDLDVDLALDFPYTSYLQDVTCHYKINDGNWTEAPMTGDGSGIYEFTIDGQAPGSIIAYYFGAHDLNGSISAVKPIGAHLNPFPNLPYYTLVGVQEIGLHDSDDNADFGNWSLGIPGDNATTGEWEEDVPMGSYTVDVAPGTVVAVDTQHTPGGEFCFLTGNASSESAGIGENDVDAGKTTLQSPIIDMSGLTEPIVAYWRYYTNNPPGGANPGADWWQVRMSNDGGQNWMYVEDNQTADMSWRRNAIRVADWMEPTSQMRFQFIASDSTRLGQNLDGGSLIEAAVDDFVVYDRMIVNVDEEQDFASVISIYPNPASDFIRVRSEMPLLHNAMIQLISSTGQIVYSKKLGDIPFGRTMSIETSHLAAGSYTMQLMSDEASESRVVVIE
ncbi:MAG: T9SS type A sorting domain-containing protein [Flavobacteriales bacterium]|jgi:Zn-dependent metalloprotease